MSESNKCSYVDKAHSWECPGQSPYHIDSEGNSFCTIHAVMLHRDDGLGISWQGGNLETMQSRLTTELTQNLIIQIDSQVKKVEWHGYRGERINTAFERNKFEGAGISLSDFSVETEMTFHLGYLKSFALRNLKAQALVIANGEGLERILIQTGKVGKIWLSPDRNQTFLAKSVELSDLTCTSDEASKINFRSGTTSSGIKTKLEIENCNGDQLDIYPNGLANQITLTGGSYDILSLNENQGQYSSSATLTVQGEIEVKSQILVNTRNGFPTINLLEVNALKAKVTIHGQNDSEGSVYIEGGEYLVIEHKTSRSFTSARTWVATLCLSDSSTSYPRYSLTNTYIAKELNFVGSQESPVGDRNKFSCKRFEMLGGRVSSLTCSNLIFTGSLKFYKANLLNELNIRESVFFDDLAIRDCFIGDSDFSGTEFKQLIDISDSKFASAPKFFKSGIGSNFRLSDKTDIFDLRSESSEQFAQLRLSMTAAKQLDYSGFFHRYELRSLSTKSVSRFLFYWLYELSSKCCQSIGRVICTLLAFNFLFAWLYCNIASSCGPPRSLRDLLPSNIDPTVANFTLSQIFKPFSIWDGKSAAVVNFLDKLTPGAPNWLPTAASMQSITTAVLLGLLFFSIRRKFKMPN